MYIFFFNHFIVENISKHAMPFSWQCLTKRIIRIILTKIIIGIIQQQQSVKWHAQSKHLCIKKQHWNPLNDSFPFEECWFSAEWDSTTGISINLISGAFPFGAFSISVNFYSTYKVFEGNIADTRTLAGLLDRLEIKD